MHKFMKKGPSVLVAVLLSTLDPQLSTCFGQGALTPPGAPAPTMKSLDQIEPRTPISFAPFTITRPGSYYLTTNLTVSSGNAVTIATNGVTLDLNGFTIRSTAASATGIGILLNSARNITLVNGFIQGGVTNNGSGVYNGSGFAYGIYDSGTASANVLVSRISVSGCLNHGIYLDTANSTVVESCTVRTVGSYGIEASTIKQSLAFDCGYSGMTGNQVSDCRGQCTGSGNGLYANDTALNCYGQSSSGTGLYAVSALNCSGSSSGGDGVSAGTAQNCRGYSSTGTGVSATTAQNCEGSSSSGDGVSAFTTLNCYGFTSGSYGVNASHTAIGCYGICGDGAAGTYGLYAETASFCTASHFSGTAIRAIIADGCWAEDGTNNITHKYNMP